MYRRDVAVTRPKVISVRILTRKGLGPIEGDSGGKLY
jgi:hypothetical protein